MSKVISMQEFVDRVKAKQVNKELSPQQKISQSLDRINILMSELKALTQPNETFKQIQETNNANKERLEKDRQKANEAVKKAYKLKI